MLDIRLWEVGAKRPLNGTSKVKKVREKNFLLRGDFRQFANKNPAHWRHQLSRPMRIVAPMP
jgi:hypothetical protein